MTCVIWDDLSEEAIVGRPVRSRCNRPGNRICGTEKDFSSEMMRRKRFFSCLMDLAHILEIKATGFAVRHCTRASIVAQW